MERNMWPSRVFSSDLVDRELYVYCRELQRLPGSALGFLQVQSWLLAYYSTPGGHIVSCRPLSRNFLWLSCGFSETFSSFWWIHFSSSFRVHVKGQGQGSCKYRLTDLCCAYQPVLWVLTMCGPCMWSRSCETMCLLSQPQTSCWATAWCWSVQPCTLSPTCARSTRWRTWAKWSSSAWWACLAPSSAACRCESVLHWRHFFCLYTHIFIIVSFFLLFAVVWLKGAAGAQRSCCHWVELASWWVLEILKIELRIMGWMSTCCVDVLICWCQVAVYASEWGGDNYTFLQNNKSTITCCSVLRIPSTS